MADGRFNLSSANSRVSVWCVWTQSNINIEANSSLLNVAVYLRRENNGYTTYGYMDTTVKVDDVSKSENHLYFSNSGTADTLIFAKSYPINHAADGSKSVTIEVLYDATSDNCNGSGTAKVTLDTIPRKSSATLSKTSFNVGEAVTVDISRKSNSFTHSIYMKYADGKYYNPIASNVGTSWTWNTGALLYNQFKNGKTEYSADLIIRTYNGSTEIGDTYVSFTASIPENTAPVINEVKAEVINDNTTVKEWGIAVQGYSKIKVTVDASAPFESGLSYTISGGGFTGTSAVYTTGFLPAGNITFNCVVTDGSGRMASAVIEPIYVYDYVKPGISGIRVYRCDEDGTAARNGSCAFIAASGNYSSCNGNNNLTVGACYKEADAEAFTALDGEITPAGNILSDFFKQKSYQVKLIAVDTLGNTAESTVFLIPSEQVALNFIHGENIDGAAFFDYADEPGVLKINGTLKLPKKGAEREYEPVADFIVEQGTSDIWTYRKWNSGIAECWGREDYSVTLAASQGTAGISLTLTFPFEFKSAPVVTVTLLNQDKWNHWVGNVIPTVKGISRIDVHGTSAQPATGTFSIYVIGKWK